jgi:hypothetical protein
VEESKQSGQNGIRDDNRERIKMNLERKKLTHEDRRAIKKDIREVEKGTSSSGRIQGRPRRV